MAVLLSFLRFILWKVMQLIKINKTRYRSHLNRIIVACIIALALGSLAISQSLIALFPDPSGSHFHWNLLGAVVSGLIIAYVLNKYRAHDFMTEVIYVWNLKQALNKINRRLLKLQTAAQNGNAEAMLALQFSFSGSRLLWELDDNTIIMEELAIQQAQLDSWCTQYNVKLKVEDYDPLILKQF